jgi:CBS-domain-containing membrane protein
VTWLSNRINMREAIRQLEQSGFTALPVLDQHGHYVGTLAEGDLLRKITSTPGLSVDDTEQVELAAVPRRITVQAVGIDAQMEELFSRAIAQNFVPVVDSREVFIGIVRRRAILEYCAGLLRGGR